MLLSGSALGFCWLLLGILLVVVTTLTSTNPNLGSTSPNLAPYASTRGMSGRFGNHVFRNLFWHVVAERNNLYVEYERAEEIEQLLGWKLHRGRRGRLQHPSVYTSVTEANMMQVLTQTVPLDQQLYSHPEFYGQTREFCLFLRHYFEERLLYPRVNVQPDSVWVHVRLGDVAELNPGWSYYHSVLQQLTWVRGMVTSDSPEHEICQRLLTQYPQLTLAPKAWNETQLIRTALTHSHMVLSQGTFSWCMGFLAPRSTQIYFPRIKRVWHGDIFVFPDWHEVDW